MGDRIIVALDYDKKEDAEELVSALTGLISFYKVGFQLYTAVGPQILIDLKRKGLKVFLDLKLFDIPNTMAQTARVITGLAVDMFNVHLLAGKEALLRVKETTRETAARQGLIPPKILGVTILTSSQSEEWQDYGFSGQIPELVFHLSQKAKEVGLDGVVASPQDAKELKKRFGRDFLVVSPGIRTTACFSGSEDEKRDDQKRTLSPAEAFAAGCDYLVVGRPITQAPSPRKACLEILRSTERP